MKYRILASQILQYLAYNVAGEQKYLIKNFNKLLIIIFVIKENRTKYNNVIVALTNQRTSHDLLNSNNL